jgi:hypothetical protein
MRAVQVRLHESLPTATHWSYQPNEEAVAGRGNGVSYLRPTVGVRRAEHEDHDLMRPFVRRAAELGAAPCALVARSTLIPQRVVGADPDSVHQNRISIEQRGGPDAPVPQSGRERRVGSMSEVDPVG